MTLKRLESVFTLAEDSLPSSWRLASIPELIGDKGIFVDGDWVESKDQDLNGDIRLIQLADVGEGSYRNKSARFLTSAKAAELRCNFLKQGDVLIARMPDPIGRACIFPGDSQGSVTVVDVAFVRAGDDEFNHKWLMHFINAPAFRAVVASLQSGTTRKRISRKNLSRIQLPVPPRDQQDRIVAEIEKLFSRLDKAVASLKRSKANLKRYKAAVLKAAVEGKLTEEWRKQNPDVEPASKLLKRILAERRAKWEEAKLAKMKTNGKEPENDKWKEKYKEPKKSNSTIADRYPKTWIVVALNQVSFVASGQTPKGITDVSGDGQIPWFKVGDMNAPGNEHLIRSAETYLSQEEVCRLRLNVHPDGTIIFPKRGGAIATNKKRVLAQESSYDLNTMGIVPCGGTNSYLWFWFETVDLASLGDGSNVPQINHGDIETLQLPLPPCDEQREIVGRIESLLNAWNWIQGEIELNLQRTIKLRQRILVMAFSGELLRNKSQTD